MICCPPNDYLARIIWLGAHKMIIWRAPDDLVPTKNTLAHTKWLVHTK